MKGRLLKPFIIIMVITVAVILLVRHLEKRHSFSMDYFETLMQKNFYTVIDTTDGRGDLVNKDTISKFTDYDSYIKPRIKKEAIFANRTQVIFMIFQSEEDAVLVEKRYENDQVLKVYKDAFTNDDYTDVGHKPQTRNGVNYNRYYTKNLNDDYVLISQIDNTLMVAYIDKTDIEAFNKMMILLDY